MAVAERRSREGVKLLVFDWEDFRSSPLRRSLLEATEVAYDIEVVGEEGLNPFAKNEIHGISFCFDKEFAFYLRWSEPVRDFVEEFFETQGLKIDFNGKYDKKFLTIKCGIYPPATLDVRTCFYVLNTTENALDLKGLAAKYLNVDSRQFLGAGGLSEVLRSSEEIGFYGAFDAWMTFMLYQKFLEIFDTLEEDYKEHVQDLINTFSKLNHVLYVMEVVGVKVDVKRLNEMLVVVSDRISELEHELLQMLSERAGRKISINLNSTQQLGDLVFNELGFEPLARTATGRPKLDKEVLERLAEKWEFFGKYLEYKKLQKLRSTYLENWRERLVNGRLHGEFLLDTASMRLKSKNPNLQNIPNDGVVEGFSVRSLLVPEDGYKFVVWDFDQIELRVLAIVSEDPGLISIYKEGRDLHSEVAKEVFGLKCKVEEVKEKFPEVRRQAKSVNFGIAYGISPAGLARQIDTDVKRAEQIIKRWFKMFPKVEKKIEEVRNFVAVNEYVENLFGGRRYFKGLKHMILSGADYASIEAVFRQAFNSIIQSSAAIIVHKSLVNFFADAVNRFDFNPVLHIHDEIVAEVNEEEVEPFCECIKKHFEDAWDFCVPIKVSIEVTDRWA